MTGIKQKDVLRLQKSSKDRKKQGRYVVEGTKMVIEAVKAGVVCKIFVAEKWWKEYITDGKGFGKYRSDILLAAIKKCEYEVVTDKVFEEITETVTPQGIIAVAEKYDKSVSDILDNCNGDRIRVLILENLQDPGNLGTIIRTAEAADYDAIFMNKGTVDIYNPKVVRSTMGAIFRVGFAYEETAENIIKMCKNHGIAVYGSALDGSDIRGQKFPTKTAFIIGNEANGIAKETLALCDNNIRIPMAGEVESLNASVAASIIMYISNLPFL